MPPHEVLYSVNCCSAHIALIVLTNDEVEEEALAMDSIPVEHEHLRKETTCQNADEFTYSDHTLSTACDDIDAPDDETDSNDGTETDDADASCVDPTREAWRRLRESSAVLGQLLDEKIGFSTLWCGFVQPTLRESTRTLKRLDEKHQVLKTTAESLTRGTEYITQTLSGGIDKQVLSHTVHPAGADDIPETSCQSSDEEEQSQEAKESLTLLEGENDKDFSAHGGETMKIQNPQTVEVNSDIAHDFWVKIEEETTDSQQSQPPVSIPNEEGNTSGKQCQESKIIEKDARGKQQQQGDRQRQQARFAPSISRDPLRRGGTNV